MKNNGTSWLQISGFLKRVITELKWHRIRSGFKIHSVINPFDYRVFLVASECFHAPIFLSAILPTGKIPGKIPVISPLPVPFHVVPERYHLLYLPRPQV
jgi:hypothetical protein